MKRLDNKVAFISGAGSGIGRASALKFAGEGARVLVAELDAERGREVAAKVVEQGGEASFLQVDVTDEQAVIGAFQACMAQFGQVDILVNCAGGSVADDKPITEVDWDVWERTMNLDLKGTLMCCRYGIPRLVSSGGGVIVNFTSVVALKGAFPGHIYTAAKGGIISFTQALAGRYWRDGIRANAIAPGIVLSERVAGRMGIDTSAPSQAQITQALAIRSRLVDDRHPFGYGVPADIANIAAFLASDESRMINGAVIPAEGGAAAY